MPHLWPFPWSLLLVNRPLNFFCCAVLWLPQVDPLSLILPFWASHLRSFSCNDSPARFSSTLSSLSSLIYYCKAVQFGSFSDFNHFYLDTFHLFSIRPIRNTLTGPLSSPPGTFISRTPSDDTYSYCSPLISVRRGTWSSRLIWFLSFLFTKKLFCTHRKHILPCRMFFLFVCLNYKWL